MKYFSCLLLTVFAVSETALVALWNKLQGAQGFNSGYSAGYYAYAWTEMLSDDAYSWFEENDGLTRANGQRFRDMALSRGNTIELGKMYRDFRGHEPDIKPLLKSRGLNGNGKLKQDEN